MSAVIFYLKAEPGLAKPVILCRILSQGPSQKNKNNWFFLNVFVSTLHIFLMNLF